MRTSILKQSGTARWGTAFEDVVDCMDGIPDIDGSIAVGVGAAQRIRCRAAFEHVVYHINRIPDIDSQIMIGIALLMGHYAQAEEWAMQEMAEVKAAGRMQQYGFIRWYAGVAALGLGKLDMARDDLIESYTVLASLQQDHFVMPKIELAYVERAQENLLAAWKCLQESFPHLLATRSFLLLMHALPIIALLLLPQVRRNYINA